MRRATITFALDKKDRDLIFEYAARNGVSVTEYVRTAVMERVQDEIDLELWRRAKYEFDQDPTTYSAEEIAKKYL